MEGKTRVLIYPYSRLLRPFVVYQDLLGHDMKITSVVSPGGFGLAGDVIDSFGEKYVVQTDFEKEISHCDCVWFCEDEQHELPEKTLRDKLLKVLKHDKKIIYTRKERFDDIDLKPYIRAAANEKRKVDLMFMNKLLAIDVPVITILGNYKNTDQLEVQLALNYEFTKRGYKVTSIVPMRSASLLHAHTIPESVTRDQKNANDRIISINHYLKVLADDEKPDIMMVGIPGGIYPYDDTACIEFGQNIYETIHAVKSDFSILCSIYGAWIEEELEREKDLLKNRYQLAIDLVHLSPYYWNKNENSANIRRGDTIELDDDFLYEKVPRLDKSDIWNLRKYENVQKVTDQIIDALS